MLIWDLLAVIKSHAIVIVGVEATKVCTGAAVSHARQVLSSLLIPLLAFI